MNYFYGNTINPSQFQFDKIYPNRKIMDENCATDGVFIGRYVLVKYDASADINRVYIDKNGYGYSSINKELVTKLLYKDLTEKFYYDYVDGEQIFYTVKKDSSSEYAIFSQANIEVYEEEEYFKNLIIDKHAYDVRKVSYDGTVWQKSYVDNMEKYIRVANLNSGAPIFSIKPDAPTHWPITPHFEINAVENDKTKQIYSLHIQPQWGFRIGKSENLSDENILWTRECYDPHRDVIVKEYYDNLGQWKEYSDDKNIQLTTIPGAIYYNKDGFKKEKRAYSNIQDEISLTPVSSGIKYSDHMGNETVQPDIQEMKILLPSLGNAVSDMWDIVYGKERNLDINWNSTNGLRAFTTADGYKYNTKEGIETLAGCINTIHDLMGMIILEQPQSPNNANTNNIYWNGTSFTRKKKSYDYSKILSKELGDYKFQQVINPKDNYISNTYFLDAEGKTVDTEGKYNSNYTYYERLLLTNYIPTEKMVEYTPNKYYYKDTYDNYYLETQENTWDRDKKYYEIIEQGNPVTFKTSYQPGSFFYYEKNTQENKIYWRVESADMPKVNFVYSELSVRQEDGYPYKNDGSFFIRSNDGKTFIAATGDFDENAIYYKAEYTPEKIILTETRVYQITQNHFQRNEQGDYFRESFQDGKPYYYIEKIGEYSNSDFYIPNLYYYKNQNNDYLLDTSPKLTPNTKYFVFTANDYITKTNVNVTLLCFFEPNKYYITFNDKKVLAETYYSNTIYYTLGEEFYISADEKNSFSIGSLWNNQVSLVPWPVTLSRRETIYIFETLNGFAKSYNTIHGLILRLNQLMESNDVHSRDTETIKGAINKLNDIFTKFNELIPNTILTVGINGKIYSSDYITDDHLEFKINNIQHRISLSHNDVKDNDLNTIELDPSKTIRIKYDKKGHIYSIENVV